MEVKYFIEERLRLKKRTVIVSLYVKVTFDAAWLPSILKQLRELKCPRNLYKLSASYFSSRKAKLLINNCKTDKGVQTGWPQESCCGAGFWNVMYNSLLNLQFSSRNKVRAFAKDLIVLTRGACKMETENCANQDLNKLKDGPMKIK
jgi:hypothetical protein